MVGVAQKIFFQGHVSGDNMPPPLLGHCSANKACLVYSCNPIILSDTSKNPHLLPRREEVLVPLHDLVFALPRVDEISPPLFAAGISQLYPSPRRLWTSKSLFFLFLRGEVVIDRFGRGLFLSKEGRTNFNHSFCFGFMFSCLFWVSFFGFICFLFLVFVSLFCFPCFFSWDCL